MGTESSGKPVFFDPARKRWPRLRAGVTLLGLTLSLLLGALVLSILASPVLPALHLPGVSFLPQGAHALPAVPVLSPERPLTRRERALRSEQIKLARVREANLQQWLEQPRKPGLTPNRQTLAIGFFVNWDDASMSSLRQNLDHLDMVIAEWLHLAAADGSLRENDPMRTAQVAAYIRTHRPEASIVPLVNNWNGHQWEGAKLARMLANPAARARTVTELTAYVERHRFDGISIDFENVPPKAQPDFQRFMAELYAAMHPKKLLVSVNVPANDATFDYRSLVRNADHLILMAYDEHWNDSA
ncbi:MAG: polysaccharide deacetylase, partial [Candidatus Accumulibacter phosphatis]|nr:polysaccharide deacetylase [Candidatus Accumulibacter phosphatis]